MWKWLQKAGEKITGKIDREYDEIVEAPDGMAAYEKFYHRVGTLKDVNNRIIDVGCYEIEAGKKYGLQYRTYFVGDEFPTDPVLDGAGKPVKRGDKIYPNPIYATSHSSLDAEVEEFVSEEVEAPKLNPKTRLPEATVVEGFKDNAVYLSNRPFWRNSEPHLVGSITGYLNREDYIKAAIVLHGQSIVDLLGELNATA